MKGEIKLQNPIMINGKNIKKVKYDTNEITAQLFAEADTRRVSGGMGAKLAETDYGLHLYLGFASIVAVNPEYDFSDLERMKGVDVSNVMRIGRNFIVETPEETSDRNSLEATSEDTLKPSEAQ